MLKFIKKTNQAGVTLLETILVLSLIAIIMVGGINLYGNASNSMKTNATIRDVTVVSSGIRALFANSVNFDDLDEELIIDAGIPPKGLVVSSDELKSIFYTDIEVGPTGPNNIDFYVNIDQVPKSICMKLAVSNISAFSVNSQATPISPSTSASICSGDKTDLNFVFDKSN